MGWRDYPQIDTAMVAVLVASVGLDSFTSLKTLFAEELQRLAAAHRQARLKSDEPAARDAAHALRGAALNVGLTQLGQLAGRLERGEHDDEGELAGVLAASLSRLLASGAD